MRKLLFAVAAALPLGIVPFAGAGAAPQVLALVASNEAVPLICRNGECAAEFSTFCLQPERASPVEGMVYNAVGGAGIRLVATTRDGATVTLADDALRITTARTHTAVRLAVPVEVMHRRGLKTVAAVIGERVSLVPEPYPGDPRPLSEIDIAIATGPLRALGSRLVDEGGETVAAAGLANRLISALPERGRAEPAVREGLWNAAIGAGPAAREGAAALAREAYDECRARTMGGMTTLRQCLGSAHDHFIGDLNNVYWEAVKTGS